MVKWGGTPWYFRPKYMLLKQVLMIILKGAIVIGIFIFSPIVKLQLKHLTN
jgi:hypothetical protein